MNKIKRCGVNAVCGIILIIAFSSEAFSAPGEIGNVTTKIATALQSSAITAKMLTMGKSVFAFLAFLQFVWAIYQLALDNRLEIQAMVMTVIRQIIYLGMFFLIVSEGPAFLRETGLWLADAGSSISGTTSVDELFTLGLDIGWHTITAAKNAFTLSELGASVAGLFVAVFSALIIIITFTFAGITALVASCKIYVVASIGALCLGFSGNSYTKDIAVNAIRAALACGAELMTIYILIGLSNSVFASFSAEAAALQPEGIIDFSLQTLVASMIFSGLVMAMPGYIAGLFFGGGSGGSSAASAGIGMARTGAGVAARGAALTARGTKGYASLHNQARKIAETSGRMPSNWNNYREPNQSSNYVDP